MHIVLLCGLLIALAIFFVYTFDALLLLFAGVLFALVLHAFCRFVARALHVPRPVALAGVVLLGVGVTVLLVVLFAPTAFGQFESLMQRLPDALRRLLARLDHARLTPGPVSSSQATSPSHKVQKALGDVVLGALGGSVEVAAGLAIIFFVGLYGAAQPQVYVRAALALTPARERGRVQAALHTTAEQLTRWLLGRLIAMAFVGITTAIAFQLLHLPMAIALGVFAGLLTFIEYAGAVISAVPPLLLALAQSTTTALSVLVLYTALHLIEGYLLTPLLARASVRVPPAIALGAQVLLGTLVGPLGLTFSTPLLVVAISAVRAFREHDPA